MSFARELAEALESPSLPELVLFNRLDEQFDRLDEQAKAAARLGTFDEETLELAFVALLETTGVTDEAEVFEAIDEVLDDLEEGLKDMVKTALGKAAREVAKGAADAAAKKVTGIKTKTKTGKMLKHAAAGAIKQIGKDPKKAKQVLKKSAKKAGRKLLKKGMKMVFGKWVKTEAFAHGLELAEATAVGVTSYDVPSPKGVELRGGRGGDVLAFNTALAKKFQRLKKDVPGVKRVYQGYRGTGRQKFRRQLFIDFDDWQKDIDIWLDLQAVTLGGVMKTGLGRVSTSDRTVTEVYADVVKLFKQYLQRKGGVSEATKVTVY